MSTFWQKIIRPVLFRFEAERVHELGIRAMKLGFGGARPPAEYPGFGTIERFGLRFANPLGIAAGFDKNGVVIDRLASLGFGFVEAGTVTLEPQPGNPKPRLFRLPKDRALINRLGFNNEGAAALAARIEKIDRRCVVGVNIGRNKNVPNEEAVENYLRTFEAVFYVADYIAVNVSSPNTPGLRELQRGENLDELLSALQEKNRELGPKPLLLKIAPDLSDAEIAAIVDAALRFELSGLIATNTTVSREGLISNGVEELGEGGLSGGPLKDRSTSVIAEVYRRSDGKLPVIGVGGIFNAQDAFEKIAAGASLLQAYTGFVYGGPSFAHEINAGLVTILKDRGFSSLDAAVGSALRQPII